MTIQYEVKDFKTRKKMPTKSDGVMWTKSGYGGKSPCILGSKQSWKGSVLWNCVGYVFARIWECTKVKPKNYPTHAYLWYEQNVYPKGQTAKAASVAVFKQIGVKRGHILFIEYKGSDHLSFTESGYNVYDWRYVKAYKNYCLITDSKGKTTKHYNYKWDGKTLKKTGYTLKGYVYPIKVV